MNIRRMLATVMVALTALFVIPTSGAYAADGNRDNCYGRVALIYKSGSKVATEYRIQCDRTQSKITVSADATRHTSGLPTARAERTCYNTRYCIVTPKVSNPSGRQLFSGTVFSALATRGSHKVGCGYVADFPVLLDGLMNCRGGSKRL